jgi:hypothetical protein
MENFDTFKILGLSASALAVAIVYAKQRQARSSLPLPPGPSRLPFFGNLFNFPKERQQETFTAWSHQHGTI